MTQRDQSSAVERVMEILQSIDSKKKKKKLKEEVDYLSSLEKDIVNENGGVIYCSETKTWA